MRKKGKRTKGIEQAHPFDGLSRVNPNAAGVDIGAEEIVVCVAANERTQLVRGFGNYTVDLQAIADWLAEHHIKTVAMESTGVYWIPLFELLEQRGFECLLISPSSLFSHFAAFPTRISGPASFQLASLMAGFLRTPELRASAVIFYVRNRPAVGQGGGIMPARLNG